MTIEYGGRTVLEWSGVLPPLSSWIVNVSIYEIRGLGGGHVIVTKQKHVYTSIRGGKVLDSLDYNRSLRLNVKNIALS